MIGKLNNKQIVHILERNVLGRIGFCFGDHPLILPIHYVFADGYIYGQSKQGNKIDLMRKNPQVCFEVEEIDNMRNWRVILVSGTYEELKSPREENDATDLLAERFAPLNTSQSIYRPPEHVHPPEIVEKDLKAIVFRIRISEQSGRYEKATENS